MNLLSIRTHCQSIWHCVLPHPQSIWTHCQSIQYPVNTDTLSVYLTLCPTTSPVNMDTLSVYIISCQYGHIVSLSDIVSYHQSSWTACLLTEMRYAACEVMTAFIQILSSSAREGDFRNISINYAHMYIHVITHMHTITTAPVLWLYQIHGPLKQSWDLTTPIG